MKLLRCVVVSCASGLAGLLLAKLPSSVVWGMMPGRVMT